MKNYILCSILFLSCMHSFAKEYIQEYNEPDLKFNYKYTYNDSMQLQKLEYKDAYMMTITYLFYNAQKQLVRDSAVSTYESKPKIYTSIAIYNYNTSNNLDKKIFYSLDSTGRRVKGKIYYKYTYTNGRLVKIENVYYENKPIDYITTLKYDELSGNVVEVNKTKVSNQSTTKITIAYDDKVNPFYNTYNSIALLFQHNVTNLQGFDFPFSLAKNNALQTTIEYFKNNVTDRSEKYMAAYEYNSDNVAKSRTLIWWQSHLVGNQTMTYGAKATFIYISK